MDYEQASELAKCVIDVAEEQNTPVAFCIMDTSGRALVTCNMGVATTFEKLAKAKALTVLEHEHNTIALRHIYDEGTETWIKGPDSWTEWEVTHAAQHDPNFCGFGGGIRLIDPATEGVIGALGVSALSEYQDDKLANDADKLYMKGGQAS